MKSVPFYLACSALLCLALGSRMPKDGEYSSDVKKSVKYMNLESATTGSIEPVDLTLEKIASSAMSLNKLVSGNGDILIKIFEGIDSDAAKSAKISGFISESLRFSQKVTETNDLTLKEFGTLVLLNDSCSKLSHLDEEKIPKLLLPLYEMHETMAAFIFQYAKLMINELTDLNDLYLREIRDFSVNYCKLDANEFDIKFKSVRFLQKLENMTKFTQNMIARIKIVYAVFKRANTLRSTQIRDYLIIPYLKIQKELLAAIKKFIKVASLVLSNNEDSRIIPDHVSGQNYFILAKLSQDLALIVQNDLSFKKYLRENANYSLLY